MSRHSERIAVVTPFFPTKERPHNGRPTYEMVKRLALFAEVRVICPVPRYPNWIGPTSFDYVRSDTSFSLPDVTVEYIEFPAFPLLTRILNGPLCSARLVNRLRNLAPDVILNYWIYPQGYAAVQAGRILGIPTIVGAIGSDLNAIPGPVSRALTRLTLRRAALVTCKSKPLSERAVQLGADPSKVYTIGNGCDTKTFRPVDRAGAREALGISSSEQLVLFVGRLEITKGVIELLRAVADLAPRRINLHLAFIGAGTAEPIARRNANELGITGRVRFVSPLPSTAVARWLSAADLLALPSYAEGCPNVVLEAISSGRPVVATNVGGIPEIVDSSCAILVPPRDVKALSKALDAALAREWDEHAIASSFSRSWEDMAQEIYDMCVSCIKRKSSCPQSAEMVAFDR